MKFYSVNAFKETANNIFRQIEKKDWKMFLILTEQMNDVSITDRSYFVNAFNTVNRMTHKQFLQMPSHLRKYYVIFFRDKVRTVYENIMKNVKHRRFKSFSENLLNCYIKSNITKNYTPIDVTNLVGWYKGVPVIKGKNNKKK